MSKTIEYILMVAKAILDVILTIGRKASKDGS